MLRAMAMLAGIWSAGGILLAWPHLPGAWRRRLAVASSAAGLVALILAVNTEGLRESPTVGGFLLGQPFVTETASASASLPYYLLTIVCLLLGFVGLTAGDEVARRVRENWLWSAVGLSLLVTAVRFTLEKVAAPATWTYVVGVTWLAPLVGAYFLLNLRAEERPFRPLLRALVVYAFAVRGAIAALMVATTLMRLGSHYDISSLTLVTDPFSPRTYTFQAGSFEHLFYVALMPQLVAWPVYTVAAGLLGAGIARLSGAARGRPGLPAVPPGRVAPVGQD